MRHGLQNHPGRHADQCCTTFVSAAPARRHPSGRRWCKAPTVTSTGQPPKVGRTLRRGTVFKITPGGHADHAVHASPAATTATDPYAGLVQAIDGNFYGTTIGGGRLTTLRHGLQNHPGGHADHAAQLRRTRDGACPYAGLVQATDGNFYGTTFSGGATALRLWLRHGLQNHRRRAR